MPKDNHLNPQNSELGKKSVYEAEYNPEKLFPIPRKLNRERIGIGSTLPFYGFDLWNHYEVSWLNTKGKPIAALAEIIYGCESLNIIESKSMKLYFNTFNNTKFDDVNAVAAVIKKDIESRVGNTSVSVQITPISHLKSLHLFVQPDGICLDDLDIECSVYHHDADFLKTEEQFVEETLSSDLLKSNCLVTNQPDWGSIQIHYKGKKINSEGLLRYIVSFRNDNEFHEQCIEQIFMDILQHCRPEKLTVYGRFTRRGGLDINPVRSTHPIDLKTVSNIRLCRQ